MRSQLKRSRKHTRAFRVLASFAALFGLFALALTSENGTPALGATRLPNVLVIVSDDQRIGTVNMTDSSSNPWMPQVKSSFGAAGTEFAKAYASSPNCCPSRGSIFTGRYPHNTGLTSDVDDPSQPGNAGADKLDDGPGGIDAWTLQRYLDQAGYYTAIYGKYLNGWVNAHYTAPQNPDGTYNADPPAHFDYFGVFDGDYGKFYRCDTIGPDCALAVDEGTASSGGRLSPDVAQYSTTYVKNKVLSLIDTLNAPSRDKTPWLMYVAPYGPHPPGRTETQQDSERTVPDQAYTTSRPPSYDSCPATGTCIPHIADKPRYVQGTDPTYPSTVPFCCARLPNRPNSDFTISTTRANQLRALKPVDAMVGEIFNRLTTAGELNEPTIAIYISDNGYLWGEHNIEGKLNPYNESVQVPMYIRGPGVPANSVNTTPFAASNLDIAPTVLGLTGVQKQTGTPAFDGRNIYGPTDPARTQWFSEYFHQDNFKADSDPNQGLQAFEPIPNWATIRTPAGQVYTEVYAPDNVTVTDREYYVNDPYELQNIAPGNATLYQPLADQLQQYRNCAGRLGSQVSGRQPCP